MAQPQFPVSRRAWPVRRQVRVVLLVAVVALAAALFAAGALRARPETQLRPASSAASIRLSNAQLSTLEIQPVTVRTFRSEELTEGQIALNGDTATQVFSPFSGRVLSVMAGPGESVKKGSPLLRIDASEFLQAQSDLLNSVAALKHAAYEGKGGSLQDWQQSQAELAAAQTAFAAARDRLRIFGKTGAQIDAIE